MGITLRRAGLSAFAGVAVFAVGAGPAFAADPVIVPKQAGVKPSVIGGSTYRMSGLNRYEVAVNAAQRAIADNRASGETVVLASGELWPDAVSVTPLAAAYKAPVLLTSANALPGSVTQFVKANATKIKRVIVSGGPASVSDKVVAQVKSLVKGVWVERNGGANRYEVAYNNAAETVAAYHSDASVVEAHDALQSATQREQAYNAALAANTTAVTDYNTARDEAEAALTTISNGTNLDALLTAYQKAVTIQLNSQNGYNRMASDVAALENLPTNNNAKTLADYEKLLKGTALAALKQAQDDLSLKGSVQLDEAIASASQQRNASERELSTYNGDLSLAAQKLADAARDAGVNAGAVTRFQTAVQAASKAAVETKAPAVALAVAAVNRPAAGAVGDAQKALQAARDAVVKKYATPAFLATGSVYTDALATGPAAANTNSVVLLTAGPVLGAWAQKYIDFSKSKPVSVGGEAIKAAGTKASVTIPGHDRYEVSVKLAEKYFKGSVYPSVASGEIFSDAISGGSFSALYSNPLVLTRNHVLPRVVQEYLRDFDAQNNPVQAVVMGGAGTIDDATLATVNKAVSGK